jgi:23S rRNA-intervening sequence protein
VRGESDDESLREATVRPPILRVSYGLTLLLHTRVNSFPRQHRFTLGQELTRQSLELTTLLVAGNAEKDSAARLSRLEMASTTLAIVRITLRLAYDLRCFSAKEHAHIVASLEDVGRQLAGWTEYTRKTNK